MLDISELIVHHLVDAPVIALPHGMSVTKHTIMMWLASLLACSVVFLAARNKGYLRTAIDSYILFIWQDIVEPAMGEAGKPFLHFFLTQFLFIFRYEFARTCSLRRYCDGQHFGDGGDELDDVSADSFLWHPAVWVHAPLGEPHTSWCAKSLVAIRVSP
jgi:hypothetical protein